MKSYRATEGKVYVHKNNVELYGELVIINEGDKYTIQDFKQLTKENHKKQLDALYKEFETGKVVEEDNEEDTEETTEEAAEEEEE